MERRTRSLPEFREYEQQRNQVIMQMARKNPVYRDTEWECNKKRMKMARKDAAYRDLEKKKKKKMTRKDATYRDLVKIFKSWQVCDWLAKWIIMWFMDLRWPRVFRRSNVGLVTSYECRGILKHLYLYYLFNSLFRPTKIKHQNYRLLPLCKGNSFFTSLFPSQSSSNVDIVPVSWDFITWINYSHHIAHIYIQQQYL